MEFTSNTGRDKAVDVSEQMLPVWFPQSSRGDVTKSVPTKPYRPIGARPSINFKALKLIQGPQSTLWEG